MATTTSESDRPLGRLGHLMVAIAEPHRDAVAEYDRWFEAEHMYDAVLVGPGAYSANRYIATRELKALRRPLDGAVFEDATKGSSVALYYLAPGQSCYWARLSAPNGSIIRNDFQSGPAQVIMDVAPTDGAVEGDEPMRT